MPAEDVPTDEHDCDEAEDVPTDEHDCDEAEDVPTDEHDCDEVNSEEIDKMQNGSKFLVHDYNGDDDRLRQVDMKNRKLVKLASEKINDEFGWVRRNLKLRIKLHDLENDTNERVKFIDISSNGRENMIECYLNEDGNLAWVYTETCTALLQWNTLKKILPFLNFAVKLVTVVSRLGSLLSSQPITTWFSTGKNMDKKETDSENNE